MPHDTIIMGYARPRGAGGRFLDTAEFRAHVRFLLTGHTKEGEHLPNMDSQSEVDGFCRTLHFSAGQGGVDCDCDCDCDSDCTSRRARWAWIGV